MAEMPRQTAGQAPSMAIPKRWPLAVQPDNRSSNPLTDARLVNCYAEKDPDDGFQIEKRFGVGKPELTMPVGQAFGLWNFSQLITGTGAVRVMLMAVRTSSSQASVYYYAPAVLNPFRPGAGPFLLGTVNVSGGVGSLLSFSYTPAFNSNSGAVLITTGVQPYYINGLPAIGNLTQINTVSQGGNFPNSTVPGIVFLDGTTYVMDLLGNIWGSNLNDPTTWTALNVIQANAEQDAGMALAKQLVYVVAIKQWSTQFYYDAGNATGSPLSPVPGALLPYGCFSGDTIAELDGVLYWVTANRTTSPQVLELDNLKHKIVSSPAIERLLDISQPLDAFRAFTIKHGGHKLYVLTNTTRNFTIVYDIDQRLWYQWTDHNGNYYPYVAAAADLQGAQVVQHTSDGHIYPVDIDFVYPTDNGVVVPVDIYTPNFDAGIIRDKTLNAMYIEADMIAGSILNVRYTDDDYGTFSNFRNIHLNQRKPMLSNEGTFWRRAYHFRHQCPTAFRIRSADLEMDIGSK